MDRDFGEIVKFIIDKTKQNIGQFGDRLPASTSHGAYSCIEDGGWVGGFWPGICFLLHKATGDSAFLDAARSSRWRFERRLYQNPQTLDHDIGFLYSLGAVADHVLTGNTHARTLALDAASRLADRFHKNGRFLQAWNVWVPGDPFSEENKGRVIIDCLYNIQLLFWASAQTGDDRYKEIAIAHADTSLEYLLRDDFSTYHTFVFNPDTGEPLYGRTCQGASDDSCWARGQAWAIGGFAHAYRYTGIDRYLDAAYKIANVFVSSMGESAIPAWDFSLQGKPGEPLDSSAAAIAASGMLELAGFLQGEQRTYMEQRALVMISDLYEYCSSVDKPDEEGLLLHACGNKPVNKETDCSLIYGDYFFVEAVMKAMKNAPCFW